MRRTYLTLCAATLLVLGAVGQQIPLDSLRAAWTDTTLGTRQRVPALARWMERDSTLTVQQATLFVVPNGTDTNDARYVRQRGVASLALTAMYNHSNRTTKALPAAKEALHWVQRGGNVLESRWYTPTSGYNSRRSACAGRRCSIKCSLWRAMSS